MGKIVIATNVSLDGVVQDPDGKEGFTGGGWFLEHGGKDLEGWGKIEYAEALSTSALLLGRHSDEWFVDQVAGHQARRVAGWLNSLPKYLVSGTLKDPAWPRGHQSSGRTALVWSAALIAWKSASCAGCRGCHRGHRRAHG